MPESLFLFAGIDGGGGRRLAGGEERPGAAPAWRRTARGGALAGGTAVWRRRWIGEAAEELAGSGGRKWRRGGAGHRSRGRRWEPGGGVLRARRPGEVGLGGPPAGRAGRAAARRSGAPARDMWHVSVGCGWRRTLSGVGQTCPVRGGADYLGLGVERSENFVEGSIYRGRGS